MQEGLTASARKDTQAVTQIQRLAAAAGAELRTMSKHDLNMLSGNRCGLGSFSPFWWSLGKPLCFQHHLAVMAVTPLTKH
jgi:hypothetical protein